MKGVNRSNVTEIVDSSGYDTGTYSFKKKSMIIICSLGCIHKH